MVDINIFAKFSLEKDSFIDIIRKIKSGDSLLRNNFIQDYRPFILKTIVESGGKYVDLDNCEELSVALLAFNEAIDSYDEEKRASFKNFSKQVIKRRLVDHLRRNTKNKNVLPFTYFETDENEHFEERYLKLDDSDPLVGLQFKDEFNRFNTNLEQFGMSFSELINQSPKHKDSRVSCVKIAYLISENLTLYDNLIRNKTLPFNELMKSVDVSRRTIERNRKFIIGLVLILKSDLDIIKSYMKNITKTEVRL